MSKIKLTSVELKAHLKEQVDLLMLYCTQFDQGNKVVAKLMATALRVLCHTNPKKGSRIRGLLDQLDLRKGRWRNVGTSQHPKYIEFNCKIVGFSVAASVKKGDDGNILANESTLECNCLPILSGPNDQGVRLVPFSTWWTEPVAYNSNNGSVFSREQVVLSMADTDGGAHVDAEIGLAYASFRNGTFLAVRATLGIPEGISGIKEDFAFGLGVGPGFEKGFPLQGTAAASIRTIAHEVLLSLEKHAPYAFDRPYIWKFSQG